jgi:hypothetical protein
MEGISMNHQEYNGWTNYETWNVKLWIDNEEGNYNYWREEAHEVARHARVNQAWHGSTRLESATATLAEMLKDTHEANTPTVTGVYADLLNASLSEVNWHEIAAAMLEDEELTEDEEVA